MKRILTPLIFCLLGGFTFATGWLWLEIPGMVLLVYGLTLWLALAESEPVIELDLLGEEPTTAMDEFALVKYGYQVEDLRRQYLERLRLLNACPLARPILVNGVKRVSASRRRDELEAMVTASLERLIDCERFRGEYGYSHASRPEV
jgi:hypothetical protein